MKPPLNLDDSTSPPTVVHKGALPDVSRETRDGSRLWERSRCSFRRRTRDKEAQGAEQGIRRTFRDPLHTPRTLCRSLDRNAIKNALPSRFLFLVGIIVFKEIEHKCKAAGTCHLWIESPFDRAQDGSEIDGTCVVHGYDARGRGYGGAGGLCKTGWDGLYVSSETCPFTI
jgi:hypothetical protein